MSREEKVFMFHSICQVRVDSVQCAALETSYQTLPKCLHRESDSGRPSTSSNLTN